MELREQLRAVTQVFQRARTEGRKLREEATGEREALSAAEQNQQRDEWRRGAMSAEDREWERASQQRDRERRARTGDSSLAAEEPTFSTDEPTISGAT